MFKDTKKGTTHHDKDACYKCPNCGGHYFTESFRDRHDCWQSVIVENINKNQRSTNNSKLLSNS